MAKPVAADPNRGPIFSIGLPKTGTATLRTALRALGLTVSNIDKALRPDIDAGRLESLHSFIATSGADVFRGWPLPLIYRELFAAYGKQARFILTTRRSPEAWVSSFKNHVRRRGPLENLRNRKAFGRLYPHGQEQHYARWYVDYVASVWAFFRENGAEDRLLELCWERGDGWDPICTFLHEPLPAVPFPHVNRTSELEGRGVNMVVNDLLIAGYTALCGERTRSG